MNESIAVDQDHILDLITNDLVDVCNMCFRSIQRCSEKWGIPAETLLTVYREVVDKSVDEILSKEGK